MSFFGELRRGYQDGRSGAPPNARPHGFTAADELAECEALIDKLLEENASLKAQMAELQRAGEARDRSQANDVLAQQMRELESILAFPGVRNALCKALHPDTGTGGDIVSRTAIFQTLMAVFERLGIGR
jgi:hypothetical protein